MLGINDDDLQIFAINRFLGALSDKLLKLCKDDQARAILKERSEWRTTFLKYLRNRQFSSRREAELYIICVVSEYLYEMRGGNEVSIEALTRRPISLTDYEMKSRIADFGFFHFTITESLGE